MGYSLTHPYDIAIITISYIGSKSSIWDICRYVIRKGKLDSMRYSNTYYIIHKLVNNLYETTRELMSYGRLINSPVLYSNSSYGCPPPPPPHTHTHTPHPYPTPHPHPTHPHPPAHPPPISNKSSPCELCCNDANFVWRRRLAQTHLLRSGLVVILS